MPEGTISEIWRYPVSGLQGEKLTRGTILRTGVAGDHLYALRETGSRILDPLSHTASLEKTGEFRSMLELGAALAGDPQGDHELTIRAAEGTLYSSRRPDDTEELSQALGRDVEVIRYPGIVESRVRAGRTLHLITNASLQRLKLAYAAGDFDRRRFRPNFMVDAAPSQHGFVEEAWTGRDVSIGDEVLLHIEKVNPRCKVTTLGQAGLREDAVVFQTIQRENSGNLGILCSVLAEGDVAAGDTLSLA